MRRYFFILLLALLPAMSFGQDYEPFLKEGKTWEYTHRQPSSEDYYNFSRVVRGDTTINDLTYKKIYDVSTDAYQYALREEGKKVYCVFQTKDTPQLIYDFGKEAGEIISEVVDKDRKTVLKVLAVDAVKYGDRLLRRMEVVEEYLENDLVNGSSNGIWIEGLGSSCGLVSPVLLDGNYNTFHSCWVGNKNYANHFGDTNASELIYGEWWLVGWSDKGTWVNVDKKYVGHHSLSIEIPKEGYVMAYSMANEIFVGLLTLNGNEMVFGDGGGSTKVYCSLEENLFFEDHICDIKSYQLEKNQLKLYYTDDDYFLFTSDFGSRGTTSGMKSTSEAKTPAANTLYDLQGQRLIGPPTKGLYIKNGKKVVVR